MPITLDDLERQTDQEISTGVAPQLPTPSPVKGSSLDDIERQTDAEIGSPSSASIDASQPAPEEGGWSSTGRIALDLAKSVLPITDEGGIGRPQILRTLEAQGDKSAAGLLGLTGLQSPEETQMQSEIAGNRIKGTPGSVQTAAGFIPFMTPGGVTLGAAQMAGEGFSGALEEGATPGEARFAGVLKGAAGALLTGISSKLTPAIDRVALKVEEQVTKIAGERAGKIAADATAGALHGEAANATLTGADVASTLPYDPALAIEKGKEGITDPTLAMMGMVPGAGQGMRRGSLDARAEQAQRMALEKESGRSAAELSLPPDISAEGSVDSGYNAERLKELGGGAPTLPPPSIRLSDASSYQRTAEPEVITTKIANLGRDMVDVTGDSGSVKVTAREAIDAARAADDEAMRQRRITNLTNEAQDAAIDRRAGEASLKAADDEAMRRMEVSQLVDQAIGEKPEPGVHPVEQGNRQVAEGRPPEPTTPPPSPESERAATVNAVRQQIDDQWLDARNRLLDARKAGLIGKAPYKHSLTALEAEKDRRLSSVDWQVVADGKPVDASLVAPIDLPGIPRPEVDRAQQGQEVRGVAGEPRHAPESARASAASEAQPESQVRSPSAEIAKPSPTAAAEPLSNKGRSNALQEEARQGRQGRQGPSLLTEEVHTSPGSRQVEPSTGVPSSDQRRGGAAPVADGSPKPSQQPPEESTKDIRSLASSLMESVKIDRSKHVPLVAGNSASDPSVVHIDKGFPTKLRLASGKVIDPTPYLVLHERTEKGLLDQGMKYKEAHAAATAAEHTALRHDGIDPGEYDRAVKPHIDRIIKQTEHLEGDAFPAGLDTRPYRDSGLHDIADRIEGSGAKEKAGPSPVAEEVPPAKTERPRDDQGGGTGMTDGQAAAPHEVLGHGGTPKPNAAKSSTPGPSVPAGTATDPNSVAGRMKAAADDIQRIFAPQTRGDAARTSANILREHGAELAQRSDRAEKALKSARASIGSMPEADRWAFIDRIETGQKQPTTALQVMADSFRDILDRKRGEVQALGKGKLESYIENYFPHIWEDPEAAARAFRDAAAKAPMQGGRSFLKQRSIPTIAEGVKLGLKPVSDNPVDLVLLKAREMDKYILGQRLMADLKDRGFLKYVRATERAEDVAPGYARINDSIAQVYGPPTVQVNEYLDKAILEGLNKTLENLGVEHIREASTGRGNLGYSVQGGDEVHTRGGTELGVLAHEIAHQLDHKFGLGQIINQKFLKPETNALADLRSGKAADYFRKPVERTAGALEAYVQAKDRMRDVAPRTFSVLEQFLKDHPETAHLVDLKPSVDYQKQSYEKAHGGLLKMGEYMAPEPVAQVMNNYLSPGLRGGAIFDAYNTVANSMNQFQLGFSAFHLGFTSLDAATSRLAVGIENMFSGHPITAAKQIIATPLAPLTNAIMGDRVLREWYKPGSQGAEVSAIVDAMKAAGGRARMDSFYQTNITKTMIDQWHKGPVGKIFAALKLPFAGIEQLSRPIMEYIVPRQKMGVFADMARKALADLPEGASRDEMRAAMAKAWDSVDNRLGQLVYDNLFWKKAAKDLSMASVRSLGWNLGTLRELGGGALDTLAAGKRLAGMEKPEFTHRMAYLIAMPALSGLMGGIIHYLYNGKSPNELRDWFFPKTGEIDPQGRDIRMALPSYVKDVAHYAHDPVATIKGKMHPAISAFMEMINNQDYFGNEVRHSDDPLMKQLTDTALHLGESWSPFAIRNWYQSKSSNQTAIEQAANFFGVTQAPKWISMSDAEQLAAKLSQAKMRGAAPADAELQAKKNAIMVRLRNPDGSVRAGAVADLQKLSQEGGVTERQAKDAIKRSGRTFLQDKIERLDPREALRVYRQASQDEAEQIYQTIGQKIARSHMAPVEKTAIMQEFERLTASKGANRETVQDER